MTEFTKAFQDLVKDMYSAEKQVLKALPKAAKASTSPTLVAAIQKHIAETEGQVTRLEQIAEAGGFKPTGKVCAAAKGLIEEMSENIEENEKGPVLDAIIICGAQKFEHYEMGNYGTAVAWAKLLGDDKSVKLLQATLDEETNTNTGLTGIADGEVNQAALNAEGGSSTPSGSSTAPKSSQNGNTQGSGTTTSKTTEDKKVPATAGSSTSKK